MGIFFINFLNTLHMYVHIQENRICYSLVRFLTFVSIFTSVFGLNNRIQFMNDENLNFCLCYRQFVPTSASLAKSMWVEYRP